MVQQTRMIFLASLNYYVIFINSKGSERVGSIGLDRLYIRISSDKKELIIGDSGNSKEMTLSNDQHDATGTKKKILILFLQV